MMTRDFKNPYQLALGMRGFIRLNCSSRLRTSSDRILLWQKHTGKSFQQKEVETELLRPEITVHIRKNNAILYSLHSAAPILLLVPFRRLNRTTVLEIDLLHQRLNLIVLELFQPLL